MRQRPITVREQATLDRMLALRKSMGIPQKEFASIFGLIRSTLQNYEQARTPWKKSLVESAEVKLANWVEGKNLQWEKALQKFGGQQ